MRSIFSGVALFSIVALAASTAGAESSKDKHRRHQQEAAAAVIGAAAILGLGALAHSSDHHDNGNHYSDAGAEAWFEEGYRDGLYGTPYNTGAPSEAYAPGYNAGISERERQRQSAYRHDGSGGKSKSAGLAKRGCIGEASAYWGINPRDIHAVKVVHGEVQADRNTFLVEVKSGRLHGVCDMRGNGDMAGDFADGQRL
ncbi:hypothetical protein SAMN05892877_106275 [Rhizobium subbaraonis]|uniref:YpeB-like protein with protease inhibitory function n=1 Tax=Rhizobium subbaraonis TaxID=908946 RepID=A0A285UDS5_9HYPH|nr:hypothetical protein [Rhizobium subbaraonis]SOC39949.1 hypothetical protein SAMN05892877_106275 [Rhizobium subbaraonis]